MAKKIEIFENTLLKLLVRRGTDADRQNVILAEGELGYTTDTKRLFIGDGATPGGIAIGGGILTSGGGRFIGSVTDVTTLNTAVLGDIAYDIDNKKLYTLTGGSYSILGNWREIGGVYTNSDGTVIISPTNTITVGSLSAGNISSDALGNSLEVDDNDRIGLSTTSIFTNSISSFNLPYLQLPGGTAINGVNYNWPAGGVAPDLFLKIDLDGNLSWSAPFTPTALYSASTAGQLPVGSIMPFVSSSNAPYGWLLCNGQSVLGSEYPELSAVIGTTYGGDTINFNVPNFTNKVIYGVTNNPSTATVYSIASGSNCSLSASGALYIIKAKQDKVITITATVEHPLSATVNNIEQVGPFDPLSGSTVIGLKQVFDGTMEFRNGIVVDEYGRVIDSYQIENAGQTDTIESVDVVNYETSVKFLINPVEIASIPSNTTFTTNVPVYPSIESLVFVGGSHTGFITTGSSLLSSAKNIVLDCWSSSSCDTINTSESLFAAASDIQYLNNGTPTSKTLGQSEYLLNYVYSSGFGGNACSTNQVIIPLSASSAGDLTFGLRGTTQEVSNNCFIRIVGFTE